MTISNQQLTCGELDFLLQRKYKNIINGVHYILACSVKHDENNVPYTIRDADIVEWRINDIPKPTEQDIIRLLDMFGDEIETNVAIDQDDEIEIPKVYDTGV